MKEVSIENGAIVVRWKGYADRIGLGTIAIPESWRVGSEAAQTWKAVEASGWVDTDPLTRASGEIVFGLEQPPGTARGNPKHPWWSTDEGRNVAREHKEALEEHCVAYARADLDTGKGLVVRPAFAELGEALLSGECEGWSTEQIAGWRAEGTTRWLWDAKRATLYRRAEARTTREVLPGPRSIETGDGVVIGIGAGVNEGELVAVEKVWAAP